MSQANREFLQQVQRLLALIKKIQKFGEDHELPRFVTTRNIIGVLQYSGSFQSEDLQNDTFFEDFFKTLKKDQKKNYYKRVFSKLVKILDEMKEKVKLKQSSFQSLRQLVDASMSNKNEEKQEKKSKKKVSEKKKKKIEKSKNQSQQQQHEQQKDQAQLKSEAELKQKIRKKSKIIRKKLEKTLKIHPLNKQRGVDDSPSSSSGLEKQYGPRQQPQKFNHNQRIQVDKLQEKLSKEVKQQAQKREVEAKTKGTPDGENIKNRLRSKIVEKKKIFKHTVRKKRISILDPLKQQAKQKYKQRDARIAAEQQASSSSEYPQSSP